MDFVMPGWPPRPADILNQISQRKGILPDSVRSDYALSWRYHHGAHRNGNKCGKTKGYPLIGSRDRRSAVWGKSVSVRVILGGRRSINKHRKNKHKTTKHKEKTNQ